MASNFLKPYGLEVSKGSFGGVSVIHKFGQNDAVGTTFVPIARGGVYQTPQPAAATQLRIAAGNVNDDAAGTGARKVMIQGLDASGNEVMEELETNGTSAGTASTNSYIRLYRAFVSESGTYATQTSGSHSGDIVIENSAGGTTWATISSTGFPRAQTEIGVYSVPAGKRGFLKSILISTDASKTTEVLVFRRENILQTSAPYSGMRALFEYVLEGAVSNVQFDSPVKLNGPCDVGLMAKIDVGTAAVSVDFEIILIDE